MNLLKYSSDLKTVQLMKPQKTGIPSSRKTTENSKRGEDFEVKILNKSTIGGVIFPRGVYFLIWAI